MNTNFQNQYKLHQKAMVYLELMNDNRNSLQRARDFLAEFNNEKDSLAMIRIRNNREDLIRGINTIKNTYEILVSSYTDILAQIMPVAFQEPEINPAFDVNKIPSISDYLHQ